MGKGLQMQNNNSNSKLDALHFVAGRELMANIQIPNLLFINKPGKRHSVSLHVLLYCMLILFSFPTFSANVYDHADPVLVSAWAKLNQARSYRAGWRDTLPKTHSQLIEAYTTELDCAGQTITAQACFLSAANNFRALLTHADPAVVTEAEWGVQESLNDYMAGQSLLGNDLLVKGLRVRFPGVGDPEDLDQLTLLTLSEQSLQSGIDEIVDDLRTRPDLMRSRGDNPQFPFWVENSLPVAGQGELVESEFYRFSHLVERYSLAALSKGKRMFFFGNVKDIDNFPLGNFPGSEDIDLNSDGLLNEAGRTEAADQMKRTAHASYLHTAVLAAVQSDADFYDNDGYTLKRQITDAERLYVDIKEGFNPLKLQGDFVPYQPVENFIALARSRINDAVVAENMARDAQRVYDQDQNILHTTLLSQKENYLDSITQLTGLNPSIYDLSDKSQREKLLADADYNAELGYGQMGIQKKSIEDSLLAMQQVSVRIKQIPERIRIEQERQRAYARIVSSTGRQMSALSYADAIANMVVATSLGPAVNVGAAISGMLQGQKDILQATQSASIDGIQSASMIKQILLEQATLVLSLQSAQVNLDIENARYEQYKSQLERIINNYQQANENYVEAYYNNPAYRIERDQLIEAAEISFETAMTESYYAAKALEYLWSEKFNNPVMRLDGGLAESLSPSFDPFIRAESVFASRFASVRSPSLDDFMDGLQAWDVKMRQLRAPAGQSASLSLSMRKDILGYNSDDIVYDKVLFRDFISKNRKSGLNVAKDDLEFEFTIEIADESLLPNHPNIKIEDIRMNLVSGIQSIRGGSDVRPVLVDLVQLDKATIRSFFAEYPVNDDLIHYDLQEGRSIEKSPFVATVESSIDNFASPQSIPNVQLEGHSPAITRWVLRIKMNRGQNEQLVLENLDDIELDIRYHFGKPRNVAY